MMMDKVSLHDKSGPIHGKHFLKMTTPFLIKTLYFSMDLKDMEEKTLDITFQPELIGREKELEILVDRFEQAERGLGSTVFISGEAGIGKTRLVSELLDLAEDEGAEIISGRCLKDSLEPLMPLREGLREAGLSHLVAEEPPPKVISAYLIDDAGMLVMKTERDDTDIDSDIFSSMLSSVRNFVKDSLTMMGREEKGSLNTIGYGDYSILIRSLEGVSLAVVIEGTRNELLIDDMKEKLASKVHRAKEWDGETSSVEDIEGDLEWFVKSGKYDGEYLVDEPELKRENLFENVLLGFQRLANEKTVVLFLDDLQWANPSTLSLMHYLARNTTEEKILILGTYRPEDITESWSGETHQLVSPKREMMREGLLEEIDLERLTEKDVEEFVKELLEETDFEKDFLERIYKESEGNPFFLLELTKVLVDEGHIQKREDGVWKLVEPLDEIHIPEKVYEMVKKRLEDLLDEQRDLLEYASVIGEEFSGKILAEASDLDRITVVKNLNDIEKTNGLIRSLGKKFQFDHSMIREVLYNGMNESLREVYHQVVAESYETLYDDRIEEMMEYVAHHYYKAGDERAGDYLLKAAERAKERYANEEAERFYEHAVEVSESEEELKVAYEGLGDVHILMGKYEKALEEYDKVTEMLADEEYPVKGSEVLGKKSKVYQNKGEFGKSLECCERGLELVEQGGEDAQKRKPELLGAKGWTFLRKGEYHDAERVWKEAVEVAEKIGDEKELAQTRHDLGTVYWGQGRYDKALELLEEALDIRREIGDEKGIGDSLNNIAVIYDSKGKLDKALEHYEESQEIARKIGEKQGVAVSLTNIGIVYKNKGELERALENFEESLEIERNIGNKQGIANSHGNIGETYYDKGDLDKTLDNYEESLELRREIGDKQGIADSLIGIGIVYRYEGLLKKAREKLEGSLEIATEIGDRWLTILSDLELSEICLAEGRHDQALQNAEKALDISKEIGAKQEEGRSRRVLGKVYREKGELKKAEEELEKAEDIFKEAGISLEIPKVRFERALLLKKGKEREKAEEHLSKALESFEKIGMDLWVKRCKKTLEEIGSDKHN